jgi:hypothetical protein
VSGKSTKLVVRQRVEEIFRLRLGGAEFHDIREYADATADQEGKPRQPWGVSDTQLRRYIHKADALFKERIDARADHLLARHIAQRRRLYAHALEMGDLRTALAVARDEAELEGLYTRRLELTGKGGGPLQFNVEDAVEADRELEEAIGDRVRPGAGPEVPEGSAEVP